MENEEVESRNGDPAVDEETDIQHAPWRSLFNFTTKKHAVPLTLAITLSIISGIIVPTMSIFLGKIFNSFTDFGGGVLTGDELLSKVSLYGAALVAVGGAGWVCNGSYFTFWLIFGELQAKSVRDKLFDDMMEKDMEWYDVRKIGIGALIPRLQAQIRELQIATSQPMGFLTQYSVTGVAALGVAFYYSWNLTLVTLSTVPIAAVALSFISNQMQPSIETQKEGLSQASKFSTNALASIEVVKCFNGEDHEVWQYAQAIRGAARYYLRQAHSNALQIGVVRLVILGMFVQGFWYGSTLVQPGGKSAGDVLTTFWSALMATQAIEQILPQMLVLEKGRAAGATLKAIMEKMEHGRKVTNMHGHQKPGYCNGDIEIREVSFTYPSRPDVLVLDNVTFFFPAGETTFVVGRSGSGKSTLGNLLMRFYNSWHGLISIDDIAIQTLDSNWIRSNVSLVQQQSLLFNETLLRNIAFGRNDHQNVTKGDVRTACNVGLLRSTIYDLPEGLDTLVGSGGKSLSGGQRQRVAIARARLRDAPVLILDESTSALDQVSRSLVMEAIKEWRRGKTTIIITHDTSQISEENYIYVLEKGRVVEEGYRKFLSEKQSGYFGSVYPPNEKTKDMDQSSKATEKLERERKPLPPLSADSFKRRHSIVSRDSLDIEFPPRARYVPTVYAGTQHYQNRRWSTDLFSPISPISPAASTSASYRTSFAPITPLSPPLSPASPLSPFSFEFSPSRPLLSPPPDIEMVELSGLTTMSNRQSFNRSRNRQTSLTYRPDEDLERKAPRPSTKQKVSSIFEKKSKKPSKENEKKKKRVVYTIRQILATLWPSLSGRQRLILISGFFCALLHAAATPVFSYVFANLLSTFYLATGRNKAALKWSLSVLGVAVADAVASYFMHYLLEYCGQAWVDHLRIEAFKRMLQQRRAWFDKEKNSVSHLTECLDRNAEEMRNLVGRFAGFVFVAAAMTIMAVTWSLVICWRLTMVGLASAPFMYLVTRAFEFVSGKWEGRSNEASEVAGSIFRETFINIRVVRALTLETYFRRKYAQATSKTLKVGLHRSVRSGGFFGLSDSAILFVQALIFYYGAVLISDNQYTTTDILTVFSMLIFSISNANSVVGFIPQINSSRDTATRLLQLSRLRIPSTSGIAQTIHLSTPLPIHLNNLSFYYPTRPEAPVLHHITLSIQPSSFTAIVGSSGSGKSTLASLLLGLYTPTSSSSSLTYASLPHSHVNLRTLRTLIGLVPQTATLFPGTIAENIAYGLHEGSCSQNAIEAAATQAGIHEFITSLPRAYSTVIAGGVDPSSLSGGQAQRVAIARALVRRPEVLVLDEATSNLDGESARDIRSCVRRLVDEQGVAVVAITHDPEMMQTADRLAVLGDGGRIVEEGEWIDLLSRKGGELSRLMGG
ncbi:MAG: hypothetical protein M4579_000129 [Chaenotheca gracillima]|nr:MAG: hypothetical protein M4579_000129 [Chaenotheca gracillima]